MVNKKKRLFKILFFPISLLICLSIFMVSTFAQSGYQVGDNGNITSLNQLNFKDFYSERVSTIIDNNSIRVSVYNDVWAYIEYKIKPNTEYTLSFDSVGDGKIVYSIDGNTLYNIDFTSGHHYRTFTSDNNYLRFYVSWGTVETKVMILSNIMLNEGNSVLDYFPYGYYFLNSVNQVYSLYNIFNGVQVWLSNLTSDGAIVSETLSLTENQTSLTFSDLPNIRSYILNNSTQEPYTLDFYFGPNNRQYASYVITLNSYDWQPTVKLSGFSDKVFNRNNNSNTFVVNTFNESYSSLSIIDFESSADVVNSFRLSLVQADTSYYNNGYTNGYDDGLSDGRSIGYNEGYQSGYNTGTTTNLETNGIRTLFNSILSFPVDMIKNVFNFEFMGVNIASVITFIISIGIVAFVLKKFL